MAQKTTIARNMAELGTYSHDTHLTIAKCPLLGTYPPTYLPTPLLCLFSDPSRSPSLPPSDLPLSALLREDCRHWSSLGACCCFFSCCCFCCEVLLLLCCCWCCSCCAIFGGEGGGSTAVKWWWLFCCCCCCEVFGGGSFYE